MLSRSTEDRKVASGEVLRRGGCWGNAGVGMENVRRAVWRDLLMSRTVTEEAHVTHEDRVQRP